LITNEILEKEIKKNSIKNSYIFCGQDEELIKEGIKLLIKPFVQDTETDLNYIKFDGNKLNTEELINACETMPFFGEKKVVLVYRAGFLADKTDSANTNIFNQIKEYMKNIPPYTILIIYYVLSDKRETPKKNKKIMSLDKITTIVNFEKLRRDRFIKKVEEIFKLKGKEIQNVELRYFCERVPNNFDIINNEIDKIIDYTADRKIQKQDIDKLLPAKSEEDIFDLVDLISQRKIDQAIDVMDEILFKADQHILIIVSIENQFRRLYEIRMGLQNGKRLDYFISKFRLPSFVCEKLINLSNKFSLKQLGSLIKLCVDTEIRLKSTNVDKRTELELLLVNTLMIKK
jgi:DNA polymerase-3 subunit delta